MDFIEMQRAIALVAVLGALLVGVLAVTIAVFHADAVDLRRRLKLADESNKRLREMLIEAHAQLAGPLEHEPGSRRDAALDRLLRNI